MTLGRLLAFLVVLAVFPAAAKAHTTIIEPPESQFPYQQWVDEAKVPTPPGAVEVVETDLPCGYAHTAGCVNNGSIELAPPGPGEHEQELFDHELGHVFDRAILTSKWRTRFAALVGRPGDPWFPNVEEAFADTYSLCARRPRFPTLGRYRIQQAQPLTPSKLRRACRLIDEAARAYAATNM
jgi:hypothetical protein